MAFLLQLLNYLRFAALATVAVCSVAVLNALSAKLATCLLALLNVAERGGRKRPRRISVRRKQHRYRQGVLKPVDAFNDLF